jgi:hypothetical protein
MNPAVDFDAREVNLTCDPLHKKQQNTFNQSIMVNDSLKQELSSMSDTELNNFREALHAELGLELTQEDVSDDHPKQLKEELRSKARRGTTPTANRDAKRTNKRAEHSNMSKDDQQQWLPRLSRRKQETKIPALSPLPPEDDATEKGNWWRLNRANGPIAKTA